MSSKSSRHKANYPCIHTVHMHTHIPIFICTYIYIHMGIYIYIYVCKHINLFIYTNMHEQQELKPHGKIHIGINIYVNI